jgi:hypothetical protein
VHEQGRCVPPPLPPKGARVCDGRGHEDRSRQRAHKQCGGPPPSVCVWGCHASGTPWEWAPLTLSPCPPMHVQRGCVNRAACNLGTSRELGRGRGTPEPSRWCAPSPSASKVACTLGMCVSMTPRHVGSCSHPLPTGAPYCINLDKKSIVLCNLHSLINIFCFFNKIDSHENMHSSGVVILRADHSRPDCGTDAKSTQLQNSNLNGFIPD